MILPAPPMSLEARALSLHFVMVYLALALATTGKAGRRIMSKATSCRTHRRCHKSHDEVDRRRPRRVYASVPEETLPTSGRNRRIHFEHGPAVG